MFQTRAKICVPANRLWSGSRKRSKEGIATVRHLYPDFDIEGEARPTSLRAYDTVPTSTAVLSTALGKCQILLHVDSFTFEQESILKLLDIPLDGETVCNDCDRVFRMPGFRNCKYDPTYLVTVTYRCDSTSNPGDGRLDIPAANAMLLPQAIPSRKSSTKHTNSEHDWAWILHELAHGRDAAKPTRTLAFRRSDEPHPLCYAQRAADVASAGLCRVEGVPMEDAVTLRAVRRGFGIASALRICKGPSKGATAASARKLTSGVESAAYVQMLRA